jgi:cobalt-zinc-cadmium efflux system outer membrane protein
VPLPIFRTGRAEIAQANAELDAAIARRAAIEADLCARVDGARAIVAARMEALGRFDADVLAALPDLRTMAGDAYRVGGQGVYELLDAYRVTLDVVEARITLLEELALAVTEFEAIVARE